MEILKNILLGWLLIYDILVILVKPIRKELVNFLINMDK